VTPDGCAAQCPAGLVAQAGVCQKYSGALIYTPFLLVTLFLGACLGGLKYCYPTMEVVQNLIAVAAPFEWGAWLYFLLQLASDIEAWAYRTPCLALAGCGLGAQLVLGAIFLWQMDRNLEDKKFRQWDQAAECHRSRLAISAASLLNLKCFRLLYGRLLSKAVFSAYHSEQEQFFRRVNLLSVADLLCGVLPLTVSAGLALSGKRVVNQPFVCAIEVLVLGVAMALLVVYDIPKEPGFFDSSVEIDHGITDKPWKANSNFEFDLQPEVSEEVVVGDGMGRTNRVRRRILERQRGGKKGLPGIEEQDDDDEED
jgi:hypothetical protein